VGPKSKCAKVGQKLFLKSKILFCLEKILLFSNFIYFKEKDSLVNWPDIKFFNELSANILQVL